MTNPFNEEISIVGAFKTQKFDDVVIYHADTFESVFISTPITKKKRKNKPEIMRQIVPKFDNAENPESFKKTVGKIEIKPGETLKLLFICDGTSVISEKKPKKKNTFDVVFNTMPIQLKNFKISYTYIPV